MRLVTVYRKNTPFAERGCEDNYKLFPRLWQSYAHESVSSMKVFLPLISAIPFLFGGYVERCRRRLVYSTSLTLLLVGLKSDTWRIMWLCLTGCFPSVSYRYPWFEIYRIAQDIFTTKRHPAAVMSEDNTVRKIAHKWTVRFEENCDILKTIFQLRALFSDKLASQ